MVSQPRSPRSSKSFRLLLIVNEDDATLQSKLLECQLGGYHVTVTCITSALSAMKKIRAIRFPFDGMLLKHPFNPAFHLAQDPKFKLTPSGYTTDEKLAIEVARRDIRSAICKGGDAPSPSKYFPEEKHPLVTFVSGIAATYDGWWDPQRSELVPADGTDMPEDAVRVIDWLRVVTTVFPAFTSYAKDAARTQVLEPMSA